MASSSSSDEEELKRCQEAIWESQACQTREADGGDKQQSRRFVVADHEHDGNELQVTQGFRNHVATKLERLLDSCISETQHLAPKCLESKSDDEQDEGFRLFSTSVQGQEAAKALSTSRRLPAPSSSDSDSEMEARLKEAAVSIADLLPSSTHSGEIGVKKQNVEKEEDRDVGKMRRKKTKRCKQEDSLCSAHQNNSEQENSVVDTKQKKKKKRKRNSEELS